MAEKVTVLLEDEVLEQIDLMEKEGEKKTGIPHKIGRSATVRYLILKGMELLGMRKGAVN